MASRMIIPDTAFALSTGRKRPRKESKDHLRRLRGLPCCICGVEGRTEAAHIRMGSQQFGKRETGTGEKSDDCWTVPLCNEHHRLQHGIGEEQFWRVFRAAPSFNPFVLALALWRATGDEAAGRMIISEMRKP